MQLLFNVPPEADGVLLRGFLRRCAVSTELARAVKFHGSGFFADDVPILANRRVQAGQTIRFSLPADGPGVVIMGSCICHAVLRIIMWQIITGTSGISGVKRKFQNFHSREATLIYQMTYRICHIS